MQVIKGNPRSRTSIRLEVEFGVDRNLIPEVLDELQKVKRSRIYSVTRLQVERAVEKVKKEKGLL